MNEKDIKSLKWEGKDRRIRIDNGLYVNIRKNSKTYLVRKTISGKAQVITLGKHPSLPLKNARLMAMEYRLERDVSTVQVKDLTKQYMKDIVEPNSKVVNQVEGYVNNIDDEIGRIKVIDVTRMQLVEYIQTYSRERGARSSDRLRSYLIQIFSFGVELGFFNDSPMRGVTKRVTGYVDIARDRIISNEEIRQLWAWRNNHIGWQKTEDNARLIKFLLLTGLRISEAQSGYVDGDKFRMDDTKGKHPKHEKRPHWVYLTETAKQQLPLPKCTATNIQHWLKRKLEAEGAEGDKYRPHDCRRTFATLGNDNGVEPFIIERVLNHKMPGVMAIYNHAEYETERKEAAKVVEAAILKIIESR